MLAGAANPLENADLSEAAGRGGGNDHRLAFARDLTQCLAEKPHIISPKYFYDEAGSLLFERICELPEYYVTRTELDLLQRDLPAMAQTIGPNAEVLEFGAGSLHKARLLLRALESPRRFIAMDISGAHLQAAAAQLQREFPTVEIIALEGDFNALDRLQGLPAIESGSRRVGFFPGSTVGNLSPLEANRFLADSARLLVGGGLLIGVDLVKSPTVLHSAYNDAAGVTAAFNRNVLVRANRELDAGFAIDAFAHYAFYEPRLQRIEMHLICLRDQTVQIADRRFTLRAGESIHTENSRKYTVEGFRTLAARAGFTAKAVWCDPMQLFSLHWLESGLTGSEER